VLTIASQMGTSNKRKHPLFPYSFSPKNKRLGNRIGIRKLVALAIRSLISFFDMQQNCCMRMQVPKVARISVG
jgi:hypothetical protein